MTNNNVDYRAMFIKAEKQFKSATTSAKKQMQIMLINATMHRVRTMQNGKGGDASLLTRAFYVARAAKIIRSNDIIPYLEKFAGVVFDNSDKRVTDEYKLGQFVPVANAEVSTPKMEAEPWYDFLKPEPKPRPLDLRQRLVLLAKEVSAHAEKPVKGDNIPADMAATIAALVASNTESTAKVGEAA